MWYRCQAGAAVLSRTYRTSPAISSGTSRWDTRSLRTAVSCSDDQYQPCHYGKSPAITDYHEFDGRDHWTCGAPGWEAVADYALEWALKHAASRPRSTTA
jgi:hypothetical protein